MAKKIEPLLKEEIETFPFLNEEIKKENKKPNKTSTIIVTLIISAIVLYFVTQTMIAFYIGFKYYNVRFENNEVTENSDEVAVSLNSYVVNETWQKYNITNNNELSDLFSKFYSGSSITEFNNQDKIIMVLSDLGLDCNNLSISKTVDEFINASKRLFSEDNLVNELKASTSLIIGSITVELKETDNLINASFSACPVTNNLVVKKINKATTKDDYLYIYEKFGYLVESSSNIYNVYKDSLMQNSITTFTKTKESDNFSNFDILATYKFEYKKSNDNNYVLVSITPM